MTASPYCGHIDRSYTTCNRDKANHMKKAILSAALASTTLAKGWEHTLDGAYDPNDADDKKTVQALIDAAVEAERESHDAEVDRLKNKNKELLGKLAAARKGDGGDTGEVERLEREVEETNVKLRTAETALREAKRTLTAAERERDEARTSLETETTVARSLVTENALTTALTEHKVAPQFMEAAKALLGKEVTVKEVDGKRTAFVNDKPVSEYVKEWATSDAGKAFVVAPANGGGGANGGNPNGNPGAKKLADMSETERLELSRTNPAEWQRILSEGQSHKQAA